MAPWISTVADTAGHTDEMASLRSGAADPPSPAKQAESRFGPKPGALIEVLLRRTSDEKAGVRKSAIQALDAALGLPNQTPAALF